MYKIFAISGGFYYFGVETKAPEGWIAIREAAMFGGFEGGKGLPGVARGDKAAIVKLDRFSPDGEVLFPLTSVISIMPSINLYDFKGTELR